MTNPYTELAAELRRQKQRLEETPMRMRDKAHAYQGELVATLLNHHNIILAALDAADVLGAKLLEAQAAKATAELLRDTALQAMEAANEGGGQLNDDLWAEMKKQRDSAVQENDRLRAQNDALKVAVRNMQAALDMQGRTAYPMQQPVRIPDGCRGCEYRQNGLGYSKWCYLFTFAPSPTCSRCKRVSFGDATTDTPASQKDGAK